jgi:hypothetical protein
MFKSWLLHRASECIQASENPTGRYEVVDASRPAVGFETAGVKHDCSEEGADGGFKCLGELSSYVYGLHQV